MSEHGDPIEPLGDALWRPTTLTDFLLARIAEDEAFHQSFVDRAAPPYDQPHRRWLAECEAKRRIVEWAEAEATCSRHDLFREMDCGECFAATQVPLWDHQILIRLALPYADHPDYREEWRA